MSGKELTKTNDSSLRPINKQIEVRNIFSLKNIIAASVACLTFIVYLTSLQNDFINLDDDKYVYNNTHIYSLDVAFFKWAFFAVSSPDINYYQPLSYLSHALNYALWNVNPMGYHLTNNIIHALNTLIVVLLVMRLLEIYKGNNIDNGLQTTIDDSSIRIAGAVTGLLFGIHPLHVESVVWVYQRNTLLCSLFYLLSIMSYMNFRLNEKSKRHFYLSLLLFILSLMSKPMAVTLPLVLLILDWYLFNRIQSFKTFWTALVNKFPFFIFSIISSYLTVKGQIANGALKPLEAYPMMSRIIVAADSLIAYLLKMILPINLVPFYPYPTDVSLFSVKYMISIFSLAAIVATCIVIGKKQKLWAAILGYYIIVLSPVLGVAQAGDQAMADRFAYLPSLGPFILIGLLAAKTYGLCSGLSRGKVALNVTGIAIGLTVLLGLINATSAQIAIWRNSITFWTHVTDKFPGKIPMAHYNLGTFYQQLGQLDQAKNEYLTAIKIAPMLAVAHNNLGLIYAGEGRLDEAMKEYAAALHFDATLAEPHNNIGMIYADLKRVDEAISEYMAALKLLPVYPAARNNLGIAYLLQHRNDKAITEFKTALELRSNFTEAHYNLGNAYAAEGFVDEAIREYLSAIALNPAEPDVHNKLGEIYLRQNRLDEAIEEFKISVQLNPYNAMARENLDRAMH